MSRNNSQQCKVHLYRVFQRNVSPLNSLNRKARSILLTVLEMAANRNTFHIWYMNMKMCKCERFEKKVVKHEIGEKCALCTMCVCLKAERFCFWISPKVIELQSSIKKEKFMGFYLIPGLSKSDNYFSRNVHTFWS